MVRHIWHRPERCPLFRVLPVAAQHLVVILEEFQEHFPITAADNMAKLAAAATSPRAGHCVVFKPRHWRRLFLTALAASVLLYISLVVAWTAHNGSRSKQATTAVNLISYPRTQTENTTTSQTDPVPGSLQNSSAPSTPMDLPSTNVTRNYKCIGWRATGQCSANGPREPQHDQDCGATIAFGTSGYCEIEDVDSHERFRVMKRTCAKAKPGAVFQCSDAPGFANFRAEAQQVVERTTAPTFKLPQTGSRSPSTERGIVMVVYPKMVASAYATVRVLRETHGCQLPIEIWSRPDELRREPAALDPLRTLAQNSSEGNISFREISDTRATGFRSKVYAIYHSVFDQVLFLDADNAPAKDPTFLFSTPEFVKTGAIFWPDYWFPGHTIFFITDQSLVWELLDTPFVDMFEQESGQIVIDRRRHAAPLELATFYSLHRPDYFGRLRLAWGDKDLFRFAWLKLGASFHMIPSPPSVGGKVFGKDFCGMTMVQHDLNGDVLFLHRNQKKLSGKTDPKISDADRSKLPSYSLNAVQPDGYPDPAIWTHLLTFRNTSAISNYVIQRHFSEPDKQRCFGRRELDNPHFYVEEIAGLSFAGLESNLRRFAMKARQ